MHRGGVLGGRVAASADRPDRLVGDHDARQRSGVEATERGGELAHDHRQRVSRVALGERFADAQDGHQARRQCRSHFAAGIVVGLAEHVASLRVADQ